MSSLRFGSFLNLLVCAIVIGPLASRSLAQSPSELRRENERLKTRVTELENEIAQKQAEIDRLEGEIAQLRAGGPPTERTPAPPLEPEKVSIDETKPSASPRAHFAATVASYREATKDLVPPDLSGMAATDDPDRVIYLRSVEKWTKRAARDLRIPVEWHVHVVGPIAPSGRGYSIRLQAVDPKTGTLLGDPFEGALSKTEQGRLEQRARSLAGDVLVMKGVAMPSINFVPDRTEAGAFDNPRFIGPFAEYTLLVDVQSIVEKPKEPAPAEPAANEPEDEEGKSGR